MAGPVDRDPALVQRDVREGYVTRVRAEAVYGVVLDGQAAVDASATARQRGDLRACGAEVPPSDSRDTVSGTGAVKPQSP